MSPLRNLGARGAGNLSDFGKCPFFPRQTVVLHHSAHFVANGSRNFEHFAKRPNLRLVKLWDSSRGGACVVPKWGQNPHFLQLGEAKMPKNGHFGPILGHCGPKNAPKCCVFGTFWQNGPQTRVLGHFGAKICVSLRGFAHFLHFLRYLQGLGPFFAKKRIFPWALGRGVAKTP